MLLTKDIRHLYSNDFNAQCYLNRYPDIRQNSHYSPDPYQHYIEYGMYEGRLPSCDPPEIRYDTAFDAVCYLDRYPDLQQHFGSDYNRAYQHWIEYGQKEGRKPGCVYLVPTETTQPTTTAPVQDNTGAGSGTSTGVTDNVATPGGDTYTETPAPATTEEKPDYMPWIIGGAAVLFLFRKKLFKNKRK